MSRDLAGKTVGGFRLGDIWRRQISTVYAAEPTAGGKTGRKGLKPRSCATKNTAVKVVAEGSESPAVQHRTWCRCWKSARSYSKATLPLISRWSARMASRSKAGCSSARTLPLHIALRSQAKWAAQPGPLPALAGAHRH